MRNHPPTLKRGDCLQPTDLALLGTPLEFIHEDHLREREICATLDRIAAAPSPDPGDVACAAKFLQDELPLHLQDEEEDLFPLLKRRCEPEDEIGKVIDRLLKDHGHAHVDTPAVLVILSGLKQDDSGFGPEERAILGDYTAHARHHLILENAIILPFARLRLTKSDLETLTLRMGQRRQTDDGKEAPDAR